MQSRMYWCMSRMDLQRRNWIKGWWVWRNLWRWKSCWRRALWWWRARWLKRMLRQLSGCSFWVELYRRRHWISDKLHYRWRFTGSFFSCSDINLFRICSKCINKCWFIIRRAWNISNCQRSLNCPNIDNFQLQYGHSNGCLNKQTDINPDRFLIKISKENI